MIYRPPEESAPELGGRGTGRRTDFIVRRSLRAAYRVLEALARDRRSPIAPRVLARIAAVVVHRLNLLLETGADRDVDAEQYVADTLRVASRTSAALLDNPTISNRN